jgi:hypothetical protein
MDKLLLISLVLNNIILVKSETCFFAENCECTNSMNLIICTDVYTPINFPNIQFSEVRLSNCKTDLTFLIPVHRFKRILDWQYSNFYSEKHLSTSKRDFAIFRYDVYRIPSEIQRTRKYLTFLPIFRRTPGE